MLNTLAWICLAETTTKYTIRAFVRGKDGRLEGICRVFSSMERSAYNLLREGANSSLATALLRERYAIRNARWVQSAINQAGAVLKSQEEGLLYRIEMYQERIRNSKESMKRLSHLLEIQGYKARIAKLQSRVEELKEQLRRRSYPSAVFGSRKLLHKLSIAKGERRGELLNEWRKERSNHFFSIGQANQKGNANTRLIYDESDASFQLEVRNWYEEDLRLELYVPEPYRALIKDVIHRAESVRIGEHGELLEGIKGLPYSVRVMRSDRGYQVLISFDLEENNSIMWSGRVAGIDINPEGIGCTVVSNDGNLISARFFKDNRLISASSGKRKWVLENLVNKILRWCKNTHGCNALAIENLKFKGGYDFSPSLNLKLSNFMSRKMSETIRLHALKMGMLTVEVNAAYTSKVALTKYSRQFGGFNRHLLAAFVIARRALGYGEAPTESCLPKTRKERSMWNHCIMYYGYSPQIQTLLQREPMEWKSADDVNGGGEVTELLRAPPASTSGRRLSHAPMGALNTRKEASRRTGRVHPNRHTIGGDGARGHRVNPPHQATDVSPLSMSRNDTKDKEG